MGTDRYWEAWLAEDLFTFDFALLLFLNDVGRRIFSFLIWFTLIQHSCYAFVCPFDHSYWNSCRVTLSALLLVVKRHCLSNQINDSLSLFTSLARIIFFSSDETIAFRTIKATYNHSRWQNVSKLDIKSFFSVLQPFKKSKLVIEISMGRSRSKQSVNNNLKINESHIPRRSQFSYPWK